MEQNIVFEIINVLLGNDLHVRGIASKIETNHMTISRKLNELMEENVLDCRREGRNKIYFLKKSTEARNSIIMTEAYKLNKTLAMRPELRSIITRIQKESPIKLAVLFGSYAKGTADEESDIDLFIETSDRNLKKSIEKLNSKLSVKIGILKHDNLLAKEIDKYHVIIKGVELYYEKIEFFD